MSHPFVISDATPLTYAGPLPAQAEVVVIGGGVIGVCTALYLAQAGQDVLLLEKGRIAGEQSSRNWGWIRQQGRDYAELPIAEEAIGRWKELAAQTNVDFGLRQGGVTYLATSAKELSGYEKWSAFAQKQGIDTRMMTAAETAAAFPDAQRTYAGAMTTASDMRAEPWAAVPALAAITARAGVRMMESCAVRRLDLAAGRVGGVEAGPRAS